ncbi:hypothetical protein MNBD_GAMMA12-3086 [hydrothermal vent metagenome]|uniref:Uncharacterized protein n=1 Tax=hydrothermal vent metagenome TaxID=652676 RepID=A0A3B0YU62_9ZZZZ
MFISINSWADTSTKSKEVKKQSANLRVFKQQRHVPRGAPARSLTNSRGVGIVCCKTWNSAHNFKGCSNYTSRSCPNGMFIKY